MIITYPGAKPSSIRVDQLNRDDQEDIHPEVVHFGIRPPQLSYAGNPEYQKAWRAYVKFRHLIANMPKPSYEDKRKLEKKEQKLLEMRTQSKMKRGVTITVSSQNFYATGIMCDVVQVCIFSSQCQSLFYSHEDPNCHCPFILGLYYPQHQDTREDSSLRFFKRWCL